MFDDLDYETMTPLASDNPPESGTDTPPAVSDTVVQPYDETSVFAEYDKLTAPPDRKSVV